MKIGLQVQDLYSVEDVAKIFDVMPETVLRWNSRGTGPKRVIVGRRAYYRPADLKAFIDALESK